LIVDDEANILEGLKNTLDWHSLGITRIRTAQSFHEAVSTALEFEPDIALFDVCIDKYYGFDIINSLKEHGLKTEYIIISGYGEFEYARQAIACGAKRYLLKPVDRFELQTAVEEVIVKALGGTLPPRKKPMEDMDPVTGLPYSTFSKLTNKILIIVKSDYGTNLSLKSVAEKFKMNSAYLGQIFLKETQMKFSEYLLIYRMHKAKEMITQTDEKIIYIARRVGYNSLNYFYTQFHDFFHQSPRDLRAGESLEEEAP